MGKCPFSENCKLYDNESSTCSELCGNCYGSGRMAGCGRDFIEKGKKATYYKKRIRPLSYREKIMKLFGFKVFE